MNFSERIEFYSESINNAILKYANEYEVSPELKDAMLYSLNAGGKRIRPILLLEMFNVYNNYDDDINLALPFAVAIECIHTFSLIHDDLPALDNDDLRRGKPSCHKKFDEPTAILAGDALLSLAYEIVSNSEHGNTEVKLDIIKYLAKYTREMINGEFLDIKYEKKQENLNFEQIISMYEKKTCALIMFAAVAGCKAAGAGEKDIENARKFALNLGLAFQIVDDILDETGDTKTLGKPVGSDRAQGKSTVLGVLGLEEAKICAERYTCDAFKHINNIPNGEFLRNLTESLLLRKN